MKCLFLLPVNSQPRFAKRIKGLMAVGVEAFALYFERPYFKGKNLPCLSRSIGHIEHGKYIKRIYPMLRAFLTIRKAAKKYDLLYAFGMDMALLVILAKSDASCKVVYEIGDIRKVQLAVGIKGDLVRFVERKIINRLDKIVVTAPGFVTNYYEKILGIHTDSIRVVENRLDLPPEKRPKDQLQWQKNRSFVVGYFGLLRCKRSWATLKALALKGGKNIKIVVRGYPMGIPIQKEVGEFSNIEYGGPYITPDDLSEMYANVDLIWACYSYNEVEDSHKGNWQWARTNRFYESCFFRRPMITQAGTDESRVIESQKIGIAVDLKNPEYAADQLLKQIPQKLKYWQINAAKVPDSVCVYTNEHRLLVEALK